MGLIHVDDIRAAEGRYAGPAWLALGFRPFYLLVAVFAAASVPAWLASYYGMLPGAHIDMAWHMHEMMYGFVIAVVVGFLYTAGRNWTGLWTPRGVQLGALAALWVAGRVAMLGAATPLAALVDGAFLPIAAWPLYRVLARTGNRRNMVMVLLLGLLTAFNLLFHGARLELLPIAPARPLYAAIIVVIMMEAIIGGRIIPVFTSNALSGVKPVQNVVLDRNCMALTALAGLAWALDIMAPFAAPLALAAAVAQAWRLAWWRPQATLRLPLLWILHLSYAWIPVGFLLLALAQLGLAPVSAAVHVLAVGAMGGLIAGMITRTALGHTGRPLKAGRADTAMFVLIQAGVLARLGAALLPGEFRNALLAGSGLCWSTTFLVYVIVYGPRLLAPRVDGREG
jgi:uncharacterized protein involved in response to NO